MFDIDWMLNAGVDEISGTAAVDDDSAELLEFVKSRLIPFHIAQPADLFVKLEGTCFSLLKEHRVVVCPFGPKIFSVVSLLVALALFPRVAIWRMSGSVVAKPVDRFPAGDVVSGAFRIAHS